MEKSEYQYREVRPREKKVRNSNSLTDIFTKNVNAQNFVAEIDKALPAIKKFSHDNWKQIAMVSAGISVLAAGAYLYFNQETKKPAHTRTRARTLARAPARTRTRRH